ncbi:hypothetical protein D3C81_1178650 [compost metagenome]
MLCWKANRAITIKSAKPTTFVAVAIKFNRPALFIPLRQMAFVPHSSTEQTRKVKVFPAFNEKLPKSSHTLSLVRTGKNVDR